MPKSKAQTRQVQHNEANIVFIGDSIIGRMQASTLWKEKIKPLGCLNFGVDGDRVENVLSRIKNGELNLKDKIKVIVLLVGTNNVDSTSHEIFDGISEIIKEIRKTLADVTIVLLTILPKGEYPNSYREKDEELNEMLIERFSNEANKDELSKNVQVVPIHENILGEDQIISRDLMYDFLHLTNEGYTKIFTKVYEKLCELLNVQPL